MLTGTKTNRRNYEDKMIIVKTDHEHYKMSISSAIIVIPQSINRYTLHLQYTLYQQNLPIEERNEMKKNNYIESQKINCSKK